MASPTLTHKTDSEHAVNRRQLLLGGTVLGAATLTGSAPAAASDEAPNLGPTDSGEPPQTAPAETQNVPARIPGTEMVTIYGVEGTAPYTSASPQYSTYGAWVSAHDGPIAKRLPLPAGSRIRRLHPCGYSSSGVRPMTWNLYRIEPTTTATMMFVSEWSKTYTVNGFLLASEDVNILIQPGYAYEMWTWVYNTSSPYSYDRGVTVQYYAPAGMFFPISPLRVYDSRVSGGRIYSGQERLVSVRTQLGTGTTVVPQGARAVALNVTLDATQATGWLSVRPQGTSFDGTSSINWFTSNEIIANGVTSQLGGDREVRVRGGGGGSTHFLFDVVGYYI
jgi:hypothetical protein